MAKQRHDFLRQPPINECEVRLRSKPCREAFSGQIRWVNWHARTAYQPLPGQHPSTIHGRPDAVWRASNRKLPPHKLRPTQWSRALGTSGRVKLRELVFSHHSGPMTSLTSNLTMGGMGSCSLRDAKVSSMTSQSAKNRMETLESIRSNFCWLSIREPLPRRQTAMLATVLSAH